ncbi:MAG: hypothetical protein GWN61_01740 [candidate division Zixibacteria bacterium]|nr:hypothetical protein [candidate division Zixibacteria bacterium]NIS44773.1 hypothetical protein [candidate division Zixibacteria bacterium]NIU12865.1 hypothetical protein [candidate division Zixibacteria bacterium]NIV04942.1 hypothetical protein [candidate division Zixibacteria bacterium]NIX54788.1 hypothetical protein [candidate division Zixibacteria bacterium]
MKYWITTDTHIGHKNIQKYCNRPADCDDRILLGLQVLQPDDILIHLGDVAFNDTGEDEYLSRIPCRRWLVMGNHDKSATYHLRAGWNWVGWSMQLRRFGKLIKFSHKPAPIGEEDVQIHGHFHNAKPEFWEGHLKVILSSKHRLLILEDVDYKPVPLERLIPQA